MTFQIEMKKNCGQKALATEKLNLTNQCSSGAEQVVEWLNAVVGSITAIRPKVQTHHECLALLK